MAWARSATCSLVKIDETLFATVFGATPIRLAIAALFSPAASRSRISCSRAVSSGNAVPAAGGAWSERAPAGDAWTEDRLAGSHRPDRPRDVVLLDALDQVAARTGAHGSEHGLVVLVHRQHEYGDPRCDPGQLPGGGDAVELRHVQVEQGDVGLGEQHLADRLASVGSDTGHLEVRDRAEQGGQPGTDDRMVVGDDDADGHDATTGMDTNDPAATSWRGRPRSIPPTSAARSRIASSPTPGDHAACAGAVVGHHDVQAAVAAEPRSRRWWRWHGA